MPRFIFVILFLLIIKNVFNIPNITTINAMRLRKRSTTAIAEVDVFADEIVTKTIQKKKKHAVTKEKRLSPGVSDNPCK